MSNMTFIPMIALLAACSTTATPHYDLRMGEAVRNAKLAMTINPDAGKTALAQDGTGGLDGMAAKEAAGRYQNSFKSPPPAVNVINIGGAIAGNK